MHCPIRRVRISARASTVPQFRRAHHSATARFTTITPQGTPITRDIEIWLGEPAEAYVMFDPEISKAFQTSAIANGGCSLTQDLELCPLNFHHDTRHFSHTSSPYPRLEIPQDLPRQSDGNTSRATLHGYGVTHAITLDGTADGELARFIGIDITLILFRDVPLQHKRDITTIGAGAESTKELIRYCQAIGNHLFKPLYSLEQTSLAMEKFRVESSARVTQQ
ncbi:hypothetical protein ONS96_014926 [Cadophora gregata f. sp. sojae]|nr:hypothetical protein ONS96_014926 [Cadophora gregata f. sp. sojae]